MGPSANIDTERFPRERLLKDPLPEIACEKQPIGSRCSDRSQETQLGNADILRLIDDSEIESSFFAGGETSTEPAKDIRPGDKIALRQPGPHALEDRPEDFPLLAPDPGLAAEARNIAIGIPAAQLPRIDDIAPFAVQKPL